MCTSRLSSRPLEQYGRALDLTPTAEQKVSVHAQALSDLLIYLFFREILTEIKRKYAGKNDCVGAAT